MRLCPILFSSMILLAACKPQSAPAGKAEADEPPAPPALDTITLEKRADGLSYEKGAEKPFTGTDIEPDEKKAREENRLGFVVVSPYQNGLLHGTQKTYYPNGDLQEELVCENGAKKLSTVYYSGGQKKHHVAFNAKGVAEGPYVRWYNNGNIETEGTFDENEKFHGDHRIYDENGTLAAHYTMERGRVTNIHFENERMKAARSEKRFDQPPSASPSP